MRKEEVAARLHDAWDGTVECAECHKRIRAGQYAVKIDGEWFCKECGMQIWWENNCVEVGDEDCDEDVDRQIDETWGDYCDGQYDREACGC